MPDRRLGRLIIQYFEAERRERDMTLALLRARLLIDADQQREQNRKMPWHERLANFIAFG